LNIVMDAMWGNGADWLPHHHRGQTACRDHNSRNPSFPSEAARNYPPNVDVGLRATVELKADVAASPMATLTGAACDEHGRSSTNSCSACWPCIY
jgi:hypothetical protein